MNLNIQQLAPPNPYPLSGGFNTQLPDMQRRRSSMNYTSKKARKQNWFNMFRQNKKVDTEVLLKNFDMKKDTKSFLFTIKGITSIPMRDGTSDKQPIQGAKYELEYYVTFFNKDIGSNGNFYGRTYRSRAIQLKDIGGYWEVNSQEYIYFHTSYVEKTSFAIVECVIVKDLGGSKSYSSLGYGLCSIFEFKETQTVELIKGSPRYIGQADINQNKRVNNTKLSFELRDFPAFDKLKSLIPLNCFCGNNDIIPGLQNETLPNPRGNTGNLGQVNIQVLPTTTLYIHNIQMLCSIALENRCEKFLKKMKQEKMKTARGSINQNALDNVYISERRIIVSINNTWKNVNEDTYVSMGPPNEKGISFSGGSLTLKNFICHPLVSLLFKIEYKAILPTEKYNEQVQFTLGWLCHLPTFNSAGELSEEQVEEDFELGPGKTPFGDLLWDPNTDDINYYQIKMKAFVSTNSQAPMVYDQAFQQDIRNQNKQILGLAPNGMPQLSQQEQLMLLEKEKQIKKLQDMLELQDRQRKDAERRTEHLELRNLNGQQQYNQQYDPRQDDVAKLYQLQKEQLEQQIQQMQNNMNSYMGSLGDANYQHQQQQQYYYPNQNYGNQLAQYIQQPLQSDQAQQIAMIGNVFYNMLNILGDSEKDKRIIGLSENLKKMVQQQRFDDLLAPKVPYVGMGAINLLKTTDLPITDQVNFIKMGLGDSLLHPSAQITSSSIAKEKLSMDLEKSDQLRACIITFKFICLKTPWNNIENMPKRFYFQLKFFTFPSILTDKVRIKNQQEGENAPIRPGQPYYLSKESNLYGNQNIFGNQQKNLSDTMSDPNLLSIVFEIDPSISRIKDQNIKLADYLKERFLTVDVFDGDSLFLYGTCKIPLFEILRQGRSSVVRAKECEMCDPDTGDFRGSLQLIMGNQGKIQSVSEEEIKVAQSPQKTRTQPSQIGDDKKQKYKKIVKSRPMDLTKMQETNNTTNLAATHMGPENFNKSILSQTNQSQVQYAAEQNADLRKKIRVDRIRKMTMGNTATKSSVEDPTQPDWAKYKSLREIEMIRETKKEQILNQVLNEYTSGAQQLSIVPGQLEFFSLKIHNPFNQNEVFTIYINDPDEHLLTEKELQVITDQMEWRHWVSLGKSTKPLNWDCITRSGDVILKPNDEVEILFKYLTLREATINPNIQVSTEIIKQRKIQIVVMQSNRQPYQTLEVNVVPSSSPIDHTFRFYEPQNSHVTLQIPPFIQLNYPGLTALLSRPTSLVDINKQTSFIQIETKTEDAPTIVEMILFVYGDQYREKLLATCKLEVYSLVTLYTKIKAGVQSTQTLAIPADMSRTVQLHSSVPRVIYLPKRALNQTFKIIPQSINHIQICAKTYSAMQQRIRIHCTDTMTGELVYAWLMIIDSDKPSITKTHDVVCKVNSVSVQSLEFTNRLNLKAVYEFATSRSDLVQPKQEAITFEGRESKLLDLHFAAQPKYGTAEIFFYASDLDQNVAECHLLRVAYLP